EQRHDHADRQGPACRGDLHPRPPPFVDCRRSSVAARSWLSGLVSWVGRPCAAVMSGRWKAGGYLGASRLIRSRTLAADAGLVRAWSDMIFIGSPWLVHPVSPPLPSCRGDGLSGIAWGCEVR